MDEAQRWGGEGQIESVRWRNGVEEQRSRNGRWKPRESAKKRRTRCIGVVETVCEQLLPHEAVMDAARDSASRCCCSASHHARSHGPCTVPNCRTEVALRVRGERRETALRGGGTVAPAWRRVRADCCANLIQSHLRVLVTQCRRQKARRERSRQLRVRLIRELEGGGRPAEGQGRKSRVRVERLQSPSGCVECAGAAAAVRREQRSKSDRDEMKRAVEEAGTPTCDDRE